MAITALPTPPSRQDPTNFAVQADAFLGQLPTFAIEANALQADVNTRQTAVATSATAAAASAAAAATSQSAAATSATAAASSATAAASSATNSAASATSASTSATTSNTNKNAAATSATAAATSATAAATSATNAATSATAAASSATAAASSATSASTSATSATASAASALTTRDTVISYSTAALASRTAAEVSATAAASSATSASASADAAAASFEAFDDRFLGSKSTAPVADNDGNTLVEGTIYWNSTDKALYIRNGNLWDPAAFSITGSVVSFNGRGGSVVLASSDVSAVLNNTVDITVNTLTANNINSTSDASLKENIANIDSSMLSKINPVAYTWKDTGTQSYGVLAQQLLTTMPELVQQNDTGLLSVNYIPMIAILVKAVQELQEKVNILEAKN